MGEESYTLLQVFRARLLPEKVPLEISLIGLRMDLSRRSGTGMVRVHQFVNLTGNTLRDLGLQLEDVMQIALVSSDAAFYFLEGNIALALTRVK